MPPTRTTAKGGGKNDAVSGIHLNLARAVDGEARRIWAESVWPGTIDESLMA